MTPKPSDEFYVLSILRRQKSLRVALQVAKKDECKQRNVYTDIFINNAAESLRQKFE